jgi:hypothetical protein
VLAAKAEESFWETNVPAPPIAPATKATEATPIMIPNRVRNALSLCDQIESRAIRNASQIATATRGRLFFASSPKLDELISANLYAFALHEK